MESLAYYKFDGGIEADGIKDFSINSYVLTANGITWTADGNIGYISGEGSASVASRASNGILSIVNSDFNLTSDFTISGWFRLDSGSITQNQIIVDRYGSSEATITYVVWVSSSDSKIYFRIGDGAASFYTTSAPTDALVEEVWYFFAAVVEGTSMKLHIGTNTVTPTEIASATISGSRYTGGSSDPTTMFARDGNSLELLGRLDDILFYTTALSYFDVIRRSQFKGVNQLVINDVDFSDEMKDYEIEDESIFMASSALVVCFDSSSVMENNISRYQSTLLYNNGFGLIWQGKLLDFETGDNNAKFLELFFVDYWYYCLRTPVSRTFTAQTASEIITSIINTELSDLNLGTSKITVTSSTYTIISTNRSAASIFEELASNEGFSVHIDMNKDLIFRKLLGTDSGETFTKGVGGSNTIAKYNFINTGGEIVNVVFVRGTPGFPPNFSPVAAVYEDEALIQQYGRLPVLEVNRPDLQTEDECYEWGRFVVRQKNVDPQRIRIETPLAFAVEKSELVTLVITEKSISNKQYFVQGITHLMKKRKSIMKLVHYDRDNSDLVRLVLEKAARAESYLSDSAVTFTKYKELLETITVTANFTVEKRTNSAADYGGFDYGSKYYGQMTDASWTSLLTESVGITMVQFLEDWLRIICQLPAVPNVLTGANSYLAIGAGTGLRGSSTTLPGEIARKGVDTGPSDSGIGEITWIFIMTDTEAESANFNAIGFFNDSPAGSLLMGYDNVSNFSKAAGEDVRITIRLAINGTVLTTLGADLLTDLLTGVELVDFLDKTLTRIDIPIATGAPPTQYDEGMIGSYPKFQGSSTNKVVFRIEIDTAEMDANALDGDTFVEMDLYNGVIATEIKVLDGIVSETTFDRLQKLVIRMNIKMVGP